MKKNYKINSSYGEIEISTNSLGTITISQNNNNIYISQFEIKSLARGLFGFKKDNFPQIQTSPKQQRPKLKATPRQKNNYRAQQKQSHRNAYKRWTPEEESMLKYYFKQRLSIKDIANKLGRDSGGINSRLQKLGLIK